MELAKNSLISDNCFSYFFHQTAGLGYRTPFVDLQILGNNFIEIVKNLDKINLMNVYPVDIDESDEFFSELPFKYAGTEDKKFKVRVDNKAWIYPVHNVNFDDFHAKWERRVPRLDFNNLILKVRIGNEGLTKTNPSDLKYIDFSRFKHTLITNAYSYVNELKRMFEFKQWRQYLWNEQYDIVVQLSSDSYPGDNTPRKINSYIIDWLNS